MDESAFKVLEETLHGDKPNDFDKVNLVKQATLRNYFTTPQVRCRAAYPHSPNDTKASDPQANRKQILKPDPLNGTLSPPTPSYTTSCTNSGEDATGPSLIAEEQAGGRRHAALAHRRCPQLRERIAIAQFRGGQAGCARHG